MDLKLTSEDSVKGLNQLQMTMFWKKILDFEVSISNPQIFCADHGSAIKSPEKRLFLQPKGRKVEQPRVKNCQMAMLTNPKSKSKVQV